MKGKLSNTDNHMNTLGYSDEEFNKMVSDQSEPDDGELKKVALEQTQFNDKQTSAQKKEIKKKRPFRKVIAAVLATATVAGAGIGIKKYNDYEKFVNDPVNKIKATDEYKQFADNYGGKYPANVLLSTFNSVSSEDNGTVRVEILSDSEAKSYDYNHGVEKEEGDRFNFKLLKDKIGEKYSTSDAVKLFNDETIPTLNEYLNAVEKNPNCVKIVDKEFMDYYGGGVSLNDTEYNKYASNLMDVLKGITSEYGPNSDFTVQKAVDVSDLPENSFGQPNMDCNSTVCSNAYCVAKPDGSSLHSDTFDQIVVKVDTYKDDGSSVTSYKKISKLEMLFRNVDQNSAEKGQTTDYWSMGARIVSK